MQVELLNRQRWRARIELANAIFEYRGFHCERSATPSALAMRAPIEYERIHHDTPTPALQNRAS
jgi:putative transposase